jgi:hypothetical protein
LRLPFGVSNFVKGVELGLFGGHPRPDDQLQTALDTLGKGARASAMERVARRGRRLHDLGDLAGILRLLLPPKDELGRALEGYLSLLFRRPKSRQEFESWAAKLVAASNAAAGGGFPLPPPLTTTMALLGLSTAPGSTAAPGLHTRLRASMGGEKVDGMGSPAEVTAFVPQYWLSQAAAPAAATSLGRGAPPYRAPPQKRARLHHLAVGADDFDDDGRDFADGGRRHSGRDLAIGDRRHSDSDWGRSHHHRDCHDYDSGDHHHRDDTAAGLYATGVDFSGAAKAAVFCRKCAGGHPPGKCRGRAAPGARIEDRKAQLPADLGATHPGAPCQLHPPKPPRATTHTNSQCRAPPGGPPPGGRGGGGGRSWKGSGGRREPSHRARAFLTYSQEYPEAAPPEDIEEELAGLRAAAELRA